MDSENDNEKVNKPLILPPEPTVNRFDDLDLFKDFENELPAIVYNDTQTSKSDLLTELILSPQHIDEFDLNDETSLSKYDEEEQNVLYFNDLFPFNIIQPDDLKSEKDNDDNEIDIIQSSGDMALPPRDQRHQYLRKEGCLRTLGLHTAEEMQTIGFDTYWAKSARQIPDKGDLLCHRLIACSITRRSQAPEKVTMTGPFYLRGMNVASVNVPYLLARFLRLFAAGRKSEALIAGGQFLTRLAEHLGLLTEDRLRGLTVIAPALPVIDMAKLVRLQICVEIDDTRDWVALGPERQPDAAVGAPEAAEDALVVDEGGQAVLAPV
ncbi:hypothetical protein Tco_1031776 [Tanacetum coccineum]|uniref:Uncharacterized protein n=1 Tax=Tanacetum coccineum TaxID=301880 RepID=A0ABQ5GAG4_9ASTR